MSRDTFHNDTRPRDTASSVQVPELPEQPVRGMGTGDVLDRPADGVLLQRPA